MPRLKLSPLFRDLFDFGGYKLDDICEKVDGITVVLDHTPGHGKLSDLAEGIALQGEGQVKDKTPGNQRRFGV